MEHNNLRLESKGKHDLHQLLVVLLGFDGADEERLTRALQIERRDGRKYTVANSSPSDRARSDILMVNYDNPAALREKDMILGAHPKTQVVAVSQKPLIEAPAHHIRGILIAARVLSVLDKVSVAPPGSEATSAKPQATLSTLLPQHEEKPVPQDHTNQTDTAITAPAAKEVDSIGYRVLVVDDSPAIQKSLELNLATLPQRAVCAAL